jgi:hypothetical protein
MREDEEADTEKEGFWLSRTNQMYGIIQGLNGVT